VDIQEKTSRSFSWHVRMSNCDLSVHTLYLEPLINGAFVLWSPDGESHLSAKYLPMLSEDVDSFFYRQPRTRSTSSFGGFCSLVLDVVDEKEAAC
jgi:hypothetical protein